MDRAAGLVHPPPLALELEGAIAEAMPTGLTAVGRNVDSPDDIDAAGAGCNAAEPAFPAAAAGAAGSVGTWPWVDSSAAPAAPAAAPNAGAAVIAARTTTMRVRLPT